MARHSNVVGFDDAPFPRDYRGDVPLVGAVFCGLRLDGIVVGKVRRDGANAARVVADLVSTSKFAPQLQLILLQGVAVAGFNVVDVNWLHRRVALPVLVVVRRAPRMARVRKALARVRGGERKWRLIERLGTPEPLGGLYVQRIGLTRDEAQAILGRLALSGTIPEPLRVAHLLAGALATGQSSGRV
ncbi:MAG TPA: DUF99 family protein [Gemmatimonadales bacterium]